MHPADGELQGVCGVLGTPEKARFAQRSVFPLRRQDETPSPAWRGIPDLGGARQLLSWLPSSSGLRQAPPGSFLQVAPFLFSTQWRQVGRGLCRQFLLSSLRLALVGFPRSQSSNLRPPQFCSTASRLTATLPSTATGWRHSVPSRSRLPDPR